jgi:arylformamidase
VTEEKKIFDLSVEIAPGTITWENESTPVIERVSFIEKDGYNLSRLAFLTHTGTHIDAPLHLIEGGDAIDRFPLDALVGPVQVVDARGVEREIDADLVGRALVNGCERVIFATRSSELWSRPRFSHDFVGVSVEAASLLVERSVRLVGIDYLSVGSIEAHLELLSHGVVVLEGLDTTGVRAGRYELAALPIRVAGVDGAPARAVLTAL